jgi:hypothetical protein
MRSRPAIVVTRCADLSGVASEKTEARQSKASAGLPHRSSTERRRVLKLEKKEGMTHDAENSSGA